MHQNSAPQPLTVFKGPKSRERRRRGGKRKGEGRKGKGEGNGEETEEGGKLVRPYIDR